MNFVLPQGISVAISVPASSANLGPGFDTLGLALAMYDDVEATVCAAGLTVDVEGEAAAEVPRDESHLVVRAIRSALHYMDIDAPGLAVRCVNRIPHSRGLGSSAAAAVAGVAIGNALAAQAAAPRTLTAAEMVQVASEFEGHPDNASASVLGGATISWTDRGAAPLYGAYKLNVNVDILPYVFIPATESKTSVTRNLLPSQVPHADAAFNASRAALMVAALTEEPNLLLAATDDRLHQQYRAASMAPSAALVSALRSRGVAAFVSGAGPTVLALSVGELPGRTLAISDIDGFAVHQLAVAQGVARIR